ncbi:MAG: polyprenyl synthetase family protein [Muribaculaceae bacterium]|nr:polyprenyl synthetase family protein [Muribaculaceae bacterium]
MSISLTHIQEQLRPQLDALNDIIVTTLTSNSELTNNIVTSYMKSKGKMLRPIITLLSAKFFGGINEKALNAAAALEMLHNASLIHDDVIDQATERRGFPTINNVWSNHVAVLVGDFFVTGALRCGVATGDGRILSALADMGRDLSLGEIDQVDFARKHNIDEATYMEIIRSKTASLFECCAVVGGYANNAPQTAIDELKRFARLLGICFQIKDDTFDYYHDPIVGKPTGNDLREGKVTLPLIYALNRADMPERDKMLELVNQETLSSEDIDSLIEYAKRAGGIDYAYETMKRLRDEANDVLSPYSPDETVDQLREIFDYVIERKL